LIGCGARSYHAAPATAVEMPAAAAAAAPPESAGARAADPARERCELDACADVPTSSEPSDPRASLRPRATRLVMTELQSLEALLAATPAGSSDRPKLVRRLAETYVELTLASQESKPEAVVPARKAALKHYRALIANHPDFCARPHEPPPLRGCSDEVLFYIALEHERWESSRPPARATATWPRRRRLPTGRGRATRCGASPPGSDGPRGDRARAALEAAIGPSHAAARMSLAHAPLDSEGARQLLQQRVALFARVTLLFGLLIQGAVALVYFGFRDSDFGAGAE
jgi:hypothetical protein